MKVKYSAGAQISDVSGVFSEYFYLEVSNMHRHILIYYSVCLNFSFGES